MIKSSVGKETLIKYIKQCNETIESGNQEKAEKLETMIVSVLQTEIEDIAYGLEDYSPGYIERQQINHIGDLELIRERLQVELEKVSGGRYESQQKKRMVLISHATKDAEYIKQLVELFEYIGLRDEELVCSSVPDYSIPYGENIYDWLREKFQTCDLHVIFVLSENYYRSPACLNEMGAAWVLKSKYDFLLLPGFNYGDIEGAIDPRKIGFKLDDVNTEMVKHRLGELKNKLVKEFELRAPGDTGWENKRDRFLKNVDEIKTRIKSGTEESDSYNFADVARHITSIKAKIETAIVDKSWARTQEDRLKLLRDHPSRFKCSNLILKDPIISNPDLNKGLIKVEPYDFSDDGIIVIVPRGDMRKKVKVRGRGEIEVDVFSEVLFRDIEEIDPHGSQNYPYPTLFCRFHGKHPFNRNIYYDVERGQLIDENQIEV